MRWLIDWLPFEKTNQLANKQEHLKGIFWENNKFLTGGSWYVFMQHLQFWLDSISEVSILLLDLLKTNIASQYITRMHNVQMETFLHLFAQNECFIIEIIIGGDINVRGIGNYFLSHPHNWLVLLNLFSNSFCEYNGWCFVH